MNILLYAGTLAAGLLVSGWVLGRALRAPGGFLGAFLGSSVVLMNVVVALDTLGSPVDGAHLAVGIALVTGVFAAVAKMRGPALETGEPPTGGAPPLSAAAKCLAVPTAVGLGAIVLAAAIDPLAGLDTIFRWDFLARQVFSTRTLQFYPPISAADFTQYAWPDGIAPLVSSLYLWAYLALGRIDVNATSPIVITEGVLLFYAVYRLSSVAHGRVAGLGSVAALATSGLVLWAVAMGQETGLTALSLVAMFLFLQRAARTQRAGDLVWAGIAAGAGALAREYGLCFGGLGALVLLQSRAKARAYITFGLTVFVVAAPWYLRNALKTGNPLFSHDIAGTLTTNPVLMDYLQATRRIVTQTAGWTTLVASAAVPAGLVVAMGVVGAAVQWRRQLPWVVGALTVCALWLWSVPQTSGGHRYAMRVLAPALAMTAVLAGPLLARVTKGRFSWLVLLLLTLASVDAAQRSLYLPYAPRVYWWNTDFPGMAERRKILRVWYNDPNWRAIVDAAEWRTVLTPDPGVFAQIKNQGGRPLTIFSPAVQRYLKADANPVQCLEQLRGEGVRFIFLPKGNDIVALQFRKYPFFQFIVGMRPTHEVLFGDIYDLYSPALLQVRRGRSAEGAPPQAPRADMP